MFRFLYLAAIVAVLCVCCSSCGTSTSKYTTTYNGGVYKNANLGCAAYN